MKTIREMEEGVDDITDILIQYLFKLLCGIIILLCIYYGVRMI